LVQTPYDKSQMRPAFVGEGRFGADSLFTRDAYAFVVVDWRGRFASRAALAPGGAQPGGAEDGYDTVEWIAAQPWSDGKVGTWGPSALGAAQFRTASARPPHLRCMVPVVMPLNLTYDVYFPGGALWEEFVGTLVRLGFLTRERLIEHPSRDAFWDALARRNHVRPDAVDVPTLLVGGWFDIYVDPVIETFATLRERGGPRTRADVRLVIGPWLHRTDEEENGALRFPGAVGAGLARAERFFDRCLRDLDQRDSDRAAITWFQTGADEWRSTDRWPPAGVATERYFLHADGELAVKPPSAGAPPRRFAYDPADPVPTAGGHVLSPSLPAGPQDLRVLEARGDVSSWSTEPLRDPVEIAGKVAVELHVATDRRDTDFVALLADVYPDGRSLLLTEGILRLRYRDGVERELLAEPGHVYRITVPLTNLGHTFLPGHRIRLLVTSSFHPKYHANRNDGGPLYADGPSLVATNTVHQDRDRPSVLLLPVAGR
jgi:putative CocE/NonD family hydrolase